MSYPYGGGGGYPGQGPPGGYPANPGYPGAPPGAFPQQGYPQQPQMGMPTPESASAAAYGQPGGGLPYGSAPQGGMPGQVGFSMGGPPNQGYQQPPGQPGYQQNMGGYPNPGYNTPAPPQPGYPSGGAAGYPQPGGAPGYPQPSSGAPGYPQGGGAPGYPQGSGAGYQQPGGAGYQPPGGAPGYPGQGQGHPQSAPSAPGGYGGYGQGQAAQGQAPQGNIGYGANVVPGHNVSALGQGGAHTGYKVKEDGTLRAAANFNAENDAKILRKAMKGLGTDEKAIIDILAYRTNDQRQQIKQMFKTCFGRDLIQDLRSELGGRFEDIVLALMMKPDEYDAYELKRAMRGIGTDEDAMIEILCSRSNGQIQAANLAYKTMYKSSLEKDIISDTSGHFKRLMVSMANGARQESQNVDMNKANADAQSLYQAGEKRWGTDESQFNIVMASQSYEQLRAVFDAYSRISGRDIETVLKGEMSGNLEIGMLAIVKVVKNKAGYFAEKLYKSMKGMGTDDKTLIRVIATRAEVDMVQIKQEFQKMYGKSLDAFIRDDTSGDYRRILLGMVGAGY